MCMAMSLEPKYMLMQLVVFAFLVSPKFGMVTAVVSSVGFLGNKHVNYIKYFLE